MRQSQQMHSSGRCLALTLTLTLILILTLTSKHIVGTVLPKNTMQHPHLKCCWSARSCPQPAALTLQGTPLPRGRAGTCPAQHSMHVSLSPRLGGGGRGARVAPVGHCVDQKPPHPPPPTHPPHKTKCSPSPPPHLTLCRPSHRSRSRTPRTHCQQRWVRYQVRKMQS
jgi:hypothetical protein